MLTVTFTVLVAIMWAVLVLDWILDIDRVLLSDSAFLLTSRFAYVIFLTLLFRLLNKERY